MINIQVTECCGSEDVQEVIVIYFDVKLVFNEIN